MVENLKQSVAGKGRLCSTRALMACVCLFAVAAIAATSEPVDRFVPTLNGKKLIEWGYDRPADTYLLDELTSMEQAASGFDGVVVGARLVGPGAPPVGKAKWRKAHWLGNFSGNTWSAVPMQWKNMEQAARNFASLQPERFEEMFIRFNVTPGDVDWFDVGWDAVAHNAQMAGRLIRRGKLAGMMIDTEEYQNRLFHYRQLAGQSERDLEEYRQQARLCGRQLIRAVNAEVHDLAILFTFAHSGYWPNDPAQRAAYEPDGPAGDSLLGPFIDGMLEAANEQTRFYDAYEKGYYIDSVAGFADARQRIKDAWKFSMVPEVYRERMGVAFGVWLDRDWRKNKGFYPDRIGRNYYTPKQIACKINAALRYSDRYVWVWTESIIWWQQRLRGIEPPKPIGRYLDAISEAKKDHPFGQDCSDWKTVAPRNGAAAAPDAAAQFMSSYEILGQLACGGWLFKEDPADTTLKNAAWAQPTFDTSDWRPIEIDRTWESQGIIYDGLAWYRKTVTLPSCPADKRLYLLFGACDEQSWVFVDGFQTGGLQGDAQALWTEPFAVDVTDYAGRSVLLAVAVHDSAGAGGIYKPVCFATDK